MLGRQSVGYGIDPRKTHLSRTCPVFVRGRCDGSRRLTKRGRAKQEGYADGEQNEISHDWEYRSKLLKKWNDVAQLFLRGSAVLCFNFCQ